MYTVVNPCGQEVGSSNVTFLCDADTPDIDRLRAVTMIETSLFILAEEN